MQSSGPLAVPTDASGVARLLAEASRSDAQKIGLELETGVLRADDLTPAGYDGAQGIEGLLERLKASGPYTAETREAGKLIGLSAPSGEAITLEPGGQVELSTAPHDSLLALHDDLKGSLARMVQAAEEGGLILVGGGIIPAAQEEMPWMPKGRYTIMREYFASLGAPGKYAHTMMQRTLSVQVSLDYSSGPDAVEMLRVAFLAAPIATALFAASPFDGREEANALSVRARAWRFTDPGRSGEIPACAEAGATLEDFAAYALDVPMMFRVRGDDYLPMHGASFREVLARGTWDDGDPVTVSDVWNQLGSIFTDARLKKGLIELRSTDGQLPGELDGVACFWVGLLYDATARAAAIKLLGGLDATAREAALEQVPRFGFSAAFGERPVIEPARELVAIAKAGLERRVTAGLESEGALQLFAPLERRLRQGRTAAEELLESWRGRWGRDRAHLVEALRFKAP